VLRPAVPALAEEIIAAIGTDVRDYARPFEGPFGRAVRQGVEEALDRFLDQIGRPAAPDPGRATYVQLGRGEFHAGRRLDALLSAYRLGARLSWRRFVEAGTAGGVAPDVLYALGEAIFAYIDGLSAESIEGYTDAQSAAAGERSRRRRVLARLLLQDPPADERAVRAAAEAAGWALSARVAVVVAEGEEPVAGRIGPDALGLDADGHALALLADPDAPGLRARLERALEGRRAALGPAVPWPDAAASLARARAALRLAGGGFCVADDHLPALALHADPRLAADLAAQALSPLAGDPPRTRAKLEATLRAWLDHQGRVEPVAAALGVHPQTVRYRVGQLRERFGERLDDPEERFALAFALRVVPRA
jgi:hypothetical protein